MKKVYCVFRDFGYEGLDLKHVFEKESDADDFIAKSHELYTKEEWIVE